MEEIDTTKNFSIDEQIAIVTEITLGYNSYRAPIVKNYYSCRSSQMLQLLKAVILITYVFLLWAGGRKSLETLWLAYGMFQCEVVLFAECVLTFY